jgi:uncharacterized protein YndB with AHSA1/START domain
MKQVEQTYTIKAPVAKVWQALTDTAVIERWGAGPAKMDAREGGEFSFWGGDIRGTNTKVEPRKLLEQDWYGHENPERCYKVSFTFDVDGDTTTVRLKQADVPDNEADGFVTDWREYYFDPIQKLLEQ